VTPERVMRIFSKHPSEGFSKRVIARILGVQDRSRVNPIVDSLVYSKRLIHDDTDGLYYLATKKKR
jgi:hypothetical protein